MKRKLDPTVTPQPALAPGSTGTPSVHGDSTPPDTPRRATPKRKVARAIDKARHTRLAQRDQMHRSARRDLETRRAARMETVHADAIAAARAQELAASENFAVRRGVYGRAGIATMRARAQAEADRITALPEVQGAMAAERLRAESEAQAVAEGVAALPGMQEELGSRVQRAQQGAAHPRADTRTAEGRRRSSASAREGARVREQSERRAEHRAASRASSSHALAVAPSPNWPAGSQGRSDLFAAASVPHQGVMTA